MFLYVLSKLKLEKFCFFFYGAVYIFGGQFLWTEAVQFSIDEIPNVS